MIEKVETDNYLDITSLVENNIYEKIALVTQTSSGYTKTDKGFYTFFVKDRNSNVVTAQLFNVDNFIEQGYSVSFFKNKPVKIKFIAEIYRGNWTLIVEEIELYKDIFDVSLFMGKVDKIDTTTIINFMKQLVNPDYEIPVEYQHSSLSSICYGRIGGILKLMESSIKSLASYIHLPNIDIRMLFKLFDISFNLYYQHLVKQNEMDIAINVEDIEIVLKIKLLNEDEQTKIYLTDIVMSLFSLAKPQNIYSHIITNTIFNNLRILNLIYKNNTLPLGHKAVVDNDILIRY